MERTKLNQALDLLKEWQEENHKTRAVFAVTFETPEDATTGDQVGLGGMLLGNGKNCVTGLSLYLLRHPAAIKVVADALGAAAYASVAKE